MSEQERLVEPVEVEVSTRQERERRQVAERREIERDSEIDWRSYDRHSTPSRWRVR